MTSDYMEAAQLLRNIDKRTPNTRAVGIRVPQAVVDILDEEAAKRGVTRSDIVRLALTEYLEYLAAYKSAQ